MDFTVVVQGFNLGLSVATLIVLIGIVVRARS